MAPALSADNESSLLKLAMRCFRKLRNNSTQLHRNLFSDECFYSMSGKINKQNHRIWGTEGPRETHQARRHSSTFIVWCSFSKDEVIGPYFFESENVTGNSCKRMIQFYLMSKLRNYPNNKIFQQDIAPLQYSTKEANYIYEKFPGRSMGRGDQISWPA